VENPRSSVWSIFVLVALAGCDACSGTAGIEGGPCEGENPPATCGVACNPDSPCPPAYYCGPAGTCTADCDPGVGGCTSDYYCASDGRCVPRPGRDGSPPDVSGFCAAVNVTARPVTPTVILIVDQSGSMTAEFDGRDRWNALRDELLRNPDGLVYALEGQVEFGLTLYSAVSEDVLPEGECPRLENVDPAIMNYDAIAAVYNAADPLDETPTGDTIEAVLARVLGDPDPDGNPIIFIVATDGEPDRCEALNPNPTPEAQAESISAVEHAFTSGIRTYMISVGPEVSMAHMQDMANAGIGLGGAGAAPYWIAGDEEGLREALRSIVGGVLSCEVRLEGRIDPTMACDGTVMLNGRTLPCDDPNGWRAVSETVIQVQGTACEELQSTAGSLLEAQFPCDVILI
jgi:hypothetical protein